MGTQADCLDNLDLLVNKWLNLMIQWVFQYILSQSGLIVEDSGSIEIRRVSIWRWLALI